MDIESFVGVKMTNYEIKLADTNTATSGKLSY